MISSCANGLGLPFVLEIFQFLLLGFEFVVFMGGGVGERKLDPGCHVRQVDELRATSLFCGFPKTLLLDFRLYCRLSIHPHLFLYYSLSISMHAHEHTRGKNAFYLSRSFHRIKSSFTTYKLQMGTFYPFQNKSSLRIKSKT